MHCPSCLLDSFLFRGDARSGKTAAQVIQMTSPARQTSRSGAGLADGNDAGGRGAPLPAKQVLAQVQRTMLRDLRAPSCSGPPSGPSHLGISVAVASS